MDKEIVYKKPPLGLKPRYIHDQERKMEIIAAMERFSEENYRIPHEWILELKDLCARKE